MSTASILRRLYSLDTSSPDFLHHLYPLFRHDEDERYLSNLQGSELARLVDFLDQTVGAISADRDLSRKCLHKLQAICGHRSILPSSSIVSGQITKVGRGPIAVGPIADIWEGNYLTRKVSIKCLKVSPDGDQALKKSFFEAAVMWKRLRHPNIVPFIGVTTDPLGIVSEWMLSGTLTEFVGKSPRANRTSLVLDVAEGLNYLHANHVVHGGLDGSRILVGHDDHARLADFEFLSVVRGMESAGQENECITAWAAPEIVRGGGTVTREADVFGFGMVVIEAFTGRHPFCESMAPATTSKIMDGKLPPRPREAQGLGLTDSVWDMTVRCWDRDPAQRPRIIEVVRLLRECYMMVATWTTKIMDIPARLLINSVLPFCELKDVISLGCTNKFFALVANDDTFWRRRVASNYNFTGSETVSTSGWKSIYRKLRNPRVFVWGDKCEGQLGLSQFPETTRDDVPFPVELHLPGVRVVSLAMGRGSLHMLGADGSVYVCGALNKYYESPPRRKGFSDPRTIAPTPLKLQLPAPTCSISCGDYHAMTLDTNSSVWIFTTWGRPFRLVSPFLDCSSPGTTPVQIECCAAISAVLMKSGDIYAWWVFNDTLGRQYREGMVELDKDESAKAIIPDNEMAIPCQTREINSNPVKFRKLPDLPDLLGTGLSEEERRMETKLIKIAAPRWNLIGLTNKGHVLMLHGLRDKDFNGTWRYLPNFSEIDKVKDHPAFHVTTGDDGGEIQPEVELTSDTMFITHISACDNSFFVYSSSIVLKGQFYTTPKTLPTIIPGLQNRSVISVSGSYHFGALTSSGRLLTWGKYFNGALGLGDPGKLPAGSPGGYAREEQRVQAKPYEYLPEVMVPTEVRFDHGLEAEGRVGRYCFAVAVGRDSTAALVVDLAEDEVPPEGLEQNFQARSTAFIRPW